jgi:hypothetical protein
MTLSIKIGAGCEPTPIPLASTLIHAATSVSLNP